MKPAVDQRRPQDDAIDLSLRTYLRHFVHDFLGLRGRLWRSLRTLLLEPGVLEQAALQPGELERHRLIHPARLYLLVNLLFFVLVPWFNTDIGTIWSMDGEALATLHPAYPALVEGQAAELGLDRATYMLLFDQRTGSSQGAFVVVMLPLFALLLWLMLRTRRRFFVEHLLLATTAFTVFLLLLMVLGVVGRLAIAIGGGSGAVGTAMAVALAVWTLALCLWLHRALRRYYRLARWSASLVAGPVFIAFLAPLFVYMHVLFWTAWLALAA